MWSFKRKYKNLKDFLTKKNLFAFSSDEVNHYITFEDYKHLLKLVKNKHPYRIWYDHNNNPELITVSFSTDPERIKVESWRYHVFNLKICITTSNISI